MRLSSWVGVLSFCFSTATAVLQAAGPHPALPPMGSLDGLGVNIHFTDPLPGEMEMIAAAGFKWVRMDLTWGGTERTKDAFDFSAYDRLVASLDKHGLRAVFILDYGNRHYADPGDKQPFTSRSGTPEFRQAYARWAAAAVSHFKGKGYLWELWNEPNHSGFWKPEPSAEDYAALAKAACEAIHLATPDEAIIGPATSTIDLPFLETCFKAGLLDSWCAVSVHPYRQQRPETVEEEYRNLRMLIRRYAPKDKTIPILSGEWGYSTAWKTQGKDEAASEEQQAKYVARQLLTNIANDVPLSIWYDWRDDGDDPKEAEHRFGLVRRLHHPDRDPVFDPKSTYLAVKTLTSQLAGMRFNKRLETKTDEWSLLFSRGKEMRIVWWATSREPIDASIPASPGKFAVVDHLGKPLTEIAASGETIPTLKAHIGDAPRYLTPVGPNEILSVAAAWQRLPLEVVLEPERAPDLTYSVTNPMPHPIRLESPLPATLAPAERREIKLPLARTRRERTESAVHLSVAGTRLSQKTIIVSAKPLRVTCLPPVASMFPVLIENPTGAPFNGALELDSPGATGPAEFKPLTPGPKRIPVIFAQGQLEQTLAFGLSTAPQGAYAAELRLFEGDAGSSKNTGSTDGAQRSNQSVEEQLVMASALKGFADHGKAEAKEVYSSWADGDAAVKADWSVNFKPAPQGLPVPSTAALYATYRFAPGWRFLQIAEKAPNQNVINGHPMAFGLWVHSDGKGCTARIRFIDVTGQVFQADGPKLDWTGWRFVSIPMQASEERELAHWAGANDGVIHYPIKWDTLFLLDNTDRKEVAGEVFLSSPTLFY